MTLHEQSKSFLATIAEMDGPGWHEMPPTEGREGFKGLMDLFGKGPELVRVEDHQTKSGVRLRVYSDHAEPDSSLPLVMYFHGGGWVLGDIETHDALCRCLAKQTGFVVASVDYGLAPENKFPGPLDDCCAATRYVVDHAAELGVDPERIAVVGDSAGGNLAAATVLKFRGDQGPAIKMQVLIYPVIDSSCDTPSYQEFSEGFGLSRVEMKWFWEQYLNEVSEGADPLASVSRANDLAGLPATHIVTAEYDVLRDEGERYGAQLAEAGVPVTVKRYDGMLHGFVHLQGVFDDAAVAINGVAGVLKHQLLS